MTNSQWMVEKPGPEVECLRDLPLFLNDMHRGTHIWSITKTKICIYTK